VSRQMAVFLPEPACVSKRSDSRSPAEARLRLKDHP